MDRHTCNAVVFVVALGAGVLVAACGGSDNPTTPFNPGGGPVASLHLSLDPATCRNSNWVITIFVDGISVGTTQPGAVGVIVSVGQGIHNVSARGPRVWAPVTITVSAAVYEFLFHC